MYLFVFLWVPALRDLTDDQLPFGYIFSSFMVSMMLGSLIYTTIVAFPPPDGATDSSTTLHAKLSSLVCTLAALSLLTSVVTDDPRYRFWAFCVFEACVGIYYPVQGMPLFLCVDAPLKYFSQACSVPPSFPTNIVQHCLHCHEFL